MNELKIPAVCWCYLADFSELHSTKPMTVYSLLDVPDTEALLSHIDRGRVKVTRIAMPPDCPWKAHVLTFP